MRISKKTHDKVRKKFWHDLFFGRKSFRLLKQSANNMLQASSRAWDDIPLPTTKKNKEDRELLVGMASLGSVLLARIREAEKYRLSLKFRNCKYKKYYDRKNKTTIFKCKFFKIADKEYKINYFFISNVKRKNGYKAQLIKTKLKLNLNKIEEGRFRNSQHSITEFHLFLYPKSGAKYGYLFQGKKNEKVFAKPILD